MEILLIIGLVAVLVWAAVVWKNTSLPRINWIPVMGAAVVIVGSVFGREFFSIEAGPIPITLDRILLGGLIVVFVGMVLLGYTKLQRFNLTDWAMLALTIVLCISTLTHDWTLLKNMPISRLLFYNLVPFLLYFLMRHSHVGSKELNIVAGMFAIFGVYLAGTAVAEWQGWNWAVFPHYISNVEFDEFLGRGRGPFLNPVSNGIFMIMGLGMLALWIPRLKNRTTQLALLVLVPLFLLGIYATLTRSIWLSLVIAAGLVGWLIANRQGKAGMIIIGGVCSLLLIGLSGDKLLEFKRDKNVSAHQMKQSAKLRPLFVVVAGRMFQDRPIAGCGFGQYARAKYPYLQDPSSKYPLHQTKYYMQHNIFLAYVTETGLIGLGILLLILVQFTKTAFRLWFDKKRDIAYRQLALVLMALLVCHLVNGMFHDVSIAPMLNMLLYFFAGLSVSAYERVPDLALAQREQTHAIDNNQFAIE